MKELGPSDAYIKRSKEPGLRLRCDFCSSCFVYNCDGSTAVHHNIHFDQREYLSKIEVPDG